MKKKRWLFLNISSVLLLAFTVTIYSSPAHAVIVRGSFTGTITSSYDETDYVGKGSGSGVLNGFEIAGIIQYDTSIAPSDSDPSEFKGYYLIADDSIVWMPLIDFSIDGVPVPVPTFPSPITTRDADQLLIIENNDEEDDYVNIFRDLDYSGGGRTIDYGISISLTKGSSIISDSIPLEINLEEFLGNDGSFNVMDTGTGVLVSGSFTLHSLQLSPSNSLEAIQNIISFLDSSVADGTLTGCGPGHSAQGRLIAFRNMLETVSDLIQSGEIATACEQLMDAYSRADGLERPPEFVTGPAASILAEMMLDLIAILGCY